MFATETEIETGKKYRIEKGKEAKRVKLQRESERPNQIETEASCRKVVVSN